MLLRALLCTTALSLSLMAAEPVAATAPGAAPVSAWMSWEAGVDLIGFTKPGLTAPNVILHVARMVHTPIGSAPSGVILWQPDPDAPPIAAGFICTDPAIGAYFGPKVFAGTPFEAMPVLPAKITVETSATKATSTIVAAGHTFVVTMTALAPLTAFDRPIGPMPFRQVGVEQIPGSVTVTVDGKAIEVIVPPADPVAGAFATFATTGLYHR